LKRIVLLRPSGPRNVGMILRIALNFGPAELVLVAPERPSLLIHPEFEQMSHGVDHSLGRLRVVDTTEEALEGVTLSYGFTARVRGSRIREDWGVARESMIAASADPAQKLALVFGNEVTGMNAEEAILCQHLVYMPTSDEHTSINLAVAAGIVMSGIYTGEGSRGVEPGGEYLTGEQREFLKANMTYVMVDKVAQSESAKRVIRSSIERVFSRAELETRDARAWHLMLRALGSDKIPSDFGLNPNPSAEPGTKPPRKK